MIDWFDNKNYMIETYGANVPGNVAQENVWVHLWVITNGGSVTIYENGVQTGSGSLTINTNLNNYIHMGGSYSASTSRFWDGQFDEFRLTNDIKSLDWVKTEYNNQNSPSTFYALGGEFAVEGTTVSSAEAQAGALQFTHVPSAEDFGSVSVGTTPQFIGEHIFSDYIEFGDFRDQGPGGNAFTLTARATQFSSGANSSPYSGNFKIHASGSAPVAQGGTDCATESVYSSSYMFFQGAGSISNSVNLVTASATGVANTSIRHCRIWPAVDVIVPAFQSSGIYTTTLYWVLT